MPELNPLDKMGFVETDVQKRVAAIRQAVVEAMAEVDTLPMTIPAPVRNMFFETIVSILLPRPPHKVATCDSCLSMAHSLALSALGWQDANAQRGTTPKERMGALTEQMDIALAYLGKIREGHGH